MLVHGIAVDDPKKGFSAETLTRWDLRPQQTFELEIQGNGGVYQYRLEIEHDRDKHLCRISSEKLMFDKQCLYSFDGKEAQLYRDDPSWKQGPTIPFDWSRSFIASIPERKDNTKLTWFRERMSRIYLYAIDPHGMLSMSDKEQESPRPPAARPRIMAETSVARVGRYFAKVAGFAERSSGRPAEFQT